QIELLKELLDLLQDMVVMLLSLLEDRFHEPAK
ncbi:RYR3 isoform 20, partial [Pan troglodytes]